MPKRTYRCIHIHICTNTHTYTYAYTHVGTQHTSAHRHTRTHTHTHMCTHTCSLRTITHTHARMYAYTYTRKHVCKHAHTRTGSHAYTHTHGTHTHAYTNSHARTHYWKPQCSNIIPSRKPHTKHQDSAYVTSLPALTSPFKHPKATPKMSYKSQTFSAFCSMQIRSIHLHTIAHTCMPETFLHGSSRHASVNTARSGDQVSNPG